MKNRTNYRVTCSSPTKAPLHSWEWPNQPWSRLYLDFAGPFLGHMYLVLVDAYSKWPNVALLQSITAEKTIQKLHAIFVTLGILYKVVADNGPIFTANSFRHL